jgi:hypothetical protein
MVWPDETIGGPHTLSTMSRYSAAAAVLIFVFWLQMLLAIPKLSTTSDEVVHLPAGYTYWATRDLRMNPEHPPLAKLVGALPLLALKPKLDTTTAVWASAEEYPFGYNFLYTNDAERLLFWGRLMMSFVAAIGAIPVFLWARDLFGRASGLFAVGLYAFSPNLLAHGMLVTTDVPLATFMTLALYFFWKNNTVAMGLSVGAAMACKFSGAVLPVIIIGLTVCEIVRSDDRRQQTLIKLKSLIIAGIVAVFVIEAAYMFRVPPWTYIENMRLVNANHNPNRLFYLFGDFSRTGWWYYFFLAFLVKTTIPALLTLTLATIQFASAGVLARRGETILLAAIACFFVAVTLGADQIGVRYLLPIFPLLFIWSSRIASELSRKAVGVALLCGLVGWQARSAVAAFPDYIPYFNEMVGGSVEGIQYLDDSNVDWGQGMKQVAAYIQRHHLQNVEVLSFSPLDNPAYYGGPVPKRNDLDTYRMMVSGNVHPGVYIVSAHHLIRMMYTRPEWHTSHAIDRIGESLWVYQF